MLLAYNSLTLSYQILLLVGVRFVSLLCWVAEPTCWQCAARCCFSVPAVGRWQSWCWCWHVCYHCVSVLSTWLWMRDGGNAAGRILSLVIFLLYTYSEVKVNLETSCGLFEELTYTFLPQSSLFHTFRFTCSSEMLDLDELWLLFNSEFCLLVLRLTPSDLSIVPSPEVRHVPVQWKRATSVYGICAEGQGCALVTWEHLLDWLTILNKVGTDEVVIPQ